MRSPKSAVRHKLDWLPDLPDARDKIFEPKALIQDVQKIDLRPRMGPIVDQGDLGSCTANALEGALSFLHQNFKASRLFIYWNERVMEGTTKEDAGAYIRDGIKSLVSIGVPSEVTWPYVEAKFKTKPSNAAFAEAGKHKVTTYARINSLEDGINCLAQGFPFVFGTSWYSSYDSDDVANTGMLPVVSDSDTVEGGHAMCAVGFDAVKQLLIVRNSWGTDWGDKGYCYFPYANCHSFDDLWTIRVAA